MTPKRNGNTAGFTLLEMLVVLVLVAVITAVAVPVAGGAIQTLRLQSAARHVAAALRLARGRAIRHQEIHLVSLDREQGRVTVASGDLEFQRSFRLPRASACRRRCCWTELRRPRVPRLSGPTSSLPPTGSPRPWKSGWSMPGAARSGWSRAPSAARPASCGFRRERSSEAVPQTEKDIHEGARRTTKGMINALLKGVNHVPGYYLGARASRPHKTWQGRGDWLHRVGRFTRRLTLEQRLDKYAGGTPALPGRELGTLLNYWNNLDRRFLNSGYSTTSPAQVIPVIQQRPLCRRILAPLVVEGGPSVFWSIRVYLCLFVSIRGSSSFLDSSFDFFSTQVI